MEIGECMDYNELRLGRLRLEDDDLDDSQNLTWGGLGAVFGLNRTLPEHVVEEIIWKHLASQPLRRRFELTLVSPRFRRFLSDPPEEQLWRDFSVLAPNCLQKQGCKHRGGRTVCWGADDVLQKRVMPIPVSLPVSLPVSTPAPKLEACCTDPICKDSRWLPLSGWRVSSCQGGESGLIYLQNFSDTPSRASIASGSHSRAPPASVTDWWVLNPVTKSRRELPLDFEGKLPQVRLVDRFKSGYLSWVSDDGGERMYPLLLDLQSDRWKRIGFGFVTRGGIRMGKAVLDDIVFLRYEKNSLKNLLVTYDVLQGSFREVVTTGLPGGHCDEHLFHHQGHIYLAVVLCTPSRGGRCDEMNVVIYELECTEWKWVAISEPCLWLSQKLVKIYPHLIELKFLHIQHELILASSVTERRKDGVYIILRPGRRSSICPCTAIAAFDLSARSWRREGEGRFGPKLDCCSTVFRPRLDVEA